MLRGTGRSHRCCCNCVLSFTPSQRRKSPYRPFFTLFRIRYDKRKSNQKFYGQQNSVHINISSLNKSIKLFSLMRKLSKTFYCQFYLWRLQVVVARVWITPLGLMSRERRPPEPLDTLKFNHNYRAD